MINTKTIIIGVCHGQMDPLSISYLNNHTHLTESSGECNKGHYATLTAQCSTNAVLYPATALCVEERHLLTSRLVPDCSSIFLSKRVILTKEILPPLPLHSLQRARHRVVLAHTLMRFSLMSSGVLERFGLWSGPGKQFWHISGSCEGLLPEMECVLSSPSCSSVKKIIY